MTDPARQEPLPHGEVWLVRHAATEWSEAGRHTGRSDIPLTDAGREAARELAPRLAGHPFVQTRVSPLGRARETARLAGVDLTRATSDDDLLEWDYGDYEGITTAQIRETRPDWFLWRDGCPGGESPDDVGARVDRVIDAVCAARGDVLVVAHGHLLRVLGARWMGLPAAVGGHLVLPTGGLCVLGQERGLRAIVRWAA